jgi:hypothetical protein
MEGRHGIPHIFPSHSSWQSMFLRSAASSISLLPFANAAAEQGRGVLVNDRTLDVAKPSVHLWPPSEARLAVEGTSLSTLLRLSPNLLSHPTGTGRHQSLGSVSVLPCASRNLIKICVSNNHPYKRLPEVSPYHPDAIVVAYTVDIPYPRRVEQLAYAKLALQKSGAHLSSLSRASPILGSRCRKGLAQQAVIHWTKCICTQPYNVHGGVLHPASANVWTSSLFRG